jgi:Trk K+ transport system NAD-binding subunit
MFRRDLVPEYLKTPMLLSSAIGIYAAGEAFQPETGLIGATLFGVVLANIDITGLQELRRFKESLTVFLVSGLFILLTANIDRAVLLSLSWPILLTTLAVMAVVRPLAIWLATTGASMTPRERLVISWIGPRGVVAAAMAGIAGDRLVAAGYADGALILPMVFAVIAASVLLHGATLAPLARALGLASGGHGGLLIVGASSFTVALGEALRAAGVPVVIADRTQSELRQARLAGLQTLRMEVLSELGEEILDLRDTEQLLAASPDDAYNALVCTRFGPELGRERVHQIAAETDDERQATSREWRGKIAIAPDLSYQRLAALMESGAGLVTEIIKAKDDSAVSIDPGVSWPIAIITRSGALTLVSPEQDNVSASGDLLIRLYLPALTPSPKAAGPPRWAAWRAAFHSRRIRRDPTV